MKKYFLIISCILLVIFTACKNEYKLLAETKTDFDINTNVRIYSAALNSARNYLYINNLPVTGSTFAYGGVYPSNDSYFNVTAGNDGVIIKDTLPTTTQPITTFSYNFESGKYYTIFTYDTLTTIKYKVVNDAIVKNLSDTGTRVRFANLIFSTVAGATTTFDIFSKKLNGNVMSNLSSLAVTDFMAFPSKISDSLYVRLPGSTVNLNATPFVITPDVGRYYTVLIRGSAGTGVVKTITSYTNY